MDFNARSKSENLYTEDPEVLDLLSLFLQEVDVLFSTEPGSVYGNRAVGVPFEEMLWKTNFRPSYIESIISQSIQKYCYTSEYFQWKVEVKLTKGVQQDIGLITIHIQDNNGNPVARTEFLFK
jgi:hypothetical protein